MINYYVLVAGRVQGVGFRWATLEIANELGLVGWVKTAPTAKLKSSFRASTQRCAPF